MEDKRIGLRIGLDGHKLHISRMILLVLRASAIWIRSVRQCIFAFILYHNTPLCFSRISFSDLFSGRLRNVLPQKCSPKMDHYAHRHGFCSSHK